MMNTEEIRKNVVDKFSEYVNKSLVRVIDSIEKMYGEIRLELEKFLETGILPKLLVEGYSFERLKKEFGMNPIAVFLTLDWLKKEPGKANEALEQGYDKII